VTDNSFSTDVAAIRDRARKKMGRGPVTGYYGTDPGKDADDMLDLLGSNASGF
jgi:bacterioferritin